uniref:Uncharacterized protein n=1 Tax=Arundo donax TaxID=35708 RepID=A0A0A8Y2C2_ARUDO
MHLKSSFPFFCVCMCLIVACTNQVQTVLLIIGLQNPHVSSIESIH